MSDSSSKSQHLYDYIYCS